MPSRADQQQHGRYFATKMHPAKDFFAAKLHQLTKAAETPE